MILFRFSSLCPYLLLHEKHHQTTPWPNNPALNGPAGNILQAV
jgi:hypothetical protein